MVTRIRVTLAPRVSRPSPDALFSGLCIHRRLWISTGGSIINGGRSSVADRTSPASQNDSPDGAARPIEIKKHAIGANMICWHSDC
jgi:hypothetical protein